MLKRNFSGITLREVMVLLGQGDFQLWQINAPPQSPSMYLTEAMRRFEAFDTENSEAAKLLLIDALLVEVVPNHPRSKV